MSRVTALWGTVGTCFAACVRLAVWALYVFPVLFSSASAQTAAPVIPPSDQPGRERFQFATPAGPRAEPAGPRVNLPGTVAPPGADKIRHKIRGVKIEGATVYGTDGFKPLYQDLIGHEVALTAVYNLAQRITAKYGADGYVLSRAIVPPQELSPGGAVIRLQVVEGYVDKVVWPEWLAPYRDFFSYYAAKITGERPANIRTIERYVLLAGDLPGLHFTTSLKASAKNPNAATLLVEAAYKPIDASARIDNHGPPSRGPLEYFGVATANNLFGAHDAFTFTYAGVVPAQELYYVAGNYRQVLTAEGLTAFVNASDGFGTPGTAPLQLLKYKTKTLYGDTGLSYPFIRSRELNLTLSGLVYASDSTSDTGTVSPFSEDNLRGGRVRVDADNADSFRGINQVIFLASQGINGLGSTPAGSALASPLAGHAEYTKFELTASRTQPLIDPLSVYLAGYGQYATTSLLTPEQCGFGGRFFGRAFDPSQILGDSCAMGTVEFRFDLPPFWSPVSQTELFAFTDGAQVFNRVASPGFPNWQHAASFGAGVRLGMYANINAELYVARAIDGPPDGTRLFFAVNGRF